MSRSPFSQFSLSTVSRGRIFSRTFLASLAGRVSLSLMLARWRGMLSLSTRITSRACTEGRQERRRARERERGDRKSVV